MYTQYINSEQIYEVNSYIGAGTGGGGGSMCPPRFSKIVSSLLYV